MCVVVREYRFPSDALIAFASDCFTRVGVPSEDAAWTSDTLVTADSQGRPSHGMSRLRAYIRGIERGRINARPDIRICQASPSAIVVDGDSGLGPVIARTAMQACIRYAKQTGIAAATVRRGNHAGALSRYTLLAANEGMIGLAFTNAQPAIPPWGGRKAYFGTNPIALAVGRDEAQLSIDLATSIVARGNIMMAAKAGRSIPDNWALDINGIPTTSAAEALQGAVLPMAGAKGYSLALLVEILAGVLSGAAVGENVGSIYDDGSDEPNTGMFLLAIDPGFFVGQNAFDQRLSKMEEDIRNAPLAVGMSEIRLPGELRRQIASERLICGIPLSAETIDDMHFLCEEYGLTYPTGLVIEKE